MQPDALTDSELLELIDRYSNPAYQNLSKTHKQYLADLQAEARRRNLKVKI